MNKNLRYLFLTYQLFFYLSFSASLTDSEWLEIGPNIYSYYINQTTTGYDDLPADCDWVKYTDDFVYISASGIPNYDIGPWNNPSIPGDVNYIYSVPRNPQEETGEKAYITLGQMGVLVNGVPVFSASSADTYNNKSVWNNDGYFWEIRSMDSCMGHPAGEEYHHHFWPKCLYPDESLKAHSPIYGYALDGFPIYGPYGYSDPKNAESSIKLIESSYKLRSITKRTTLPDGTILSSDKYGPDVNTEYPLGAYTQDYEYDENLGDLDEYNGRFSVTPDYPNGTYAYYTTIDSNHDPVFPYIMGFYFYGKLYDTQHNLAYDTAPSDAIEFNKTAWLEWNTTYHEVSKNDDDSSGLTITCAITFFMEIILLFSLIQS